MEHQTFKRKILALSRHIAKTYSAGTLQTNASLELNKTGPSTATITVKSRTNPNGLGDSRMCWLEFNSDNYASDLATAKFNCFKLWRNTLSAFEQSDIKPR